MDAIIFSKIIKINTGQIVETGDSIEKIEVDQGMKKIIEEEILEVTQDYIKMLEDKTVEENTEIMLEMKVMTDVEIETGQEKDHFLEILVTEEMIGVQEIVGPDKDQGQVQIEQNQMLQM